MKKLIALSLSLLMLLSVCLTGCSEKTDEEAVEDISKKASKSAMTLSLYLMSEQPVEKCSHCVDHDAGKAGAKNCTDLKDVQPCTYRLISNAVNRITESKYKTRLILNYIAGEDAYYAALEKAFADREAARKAGTLGNTTIAEETEQDETFVNELGQIEIKYPTIAGYQVDLFFLGGSEKFHQYKDAGLLASLDSELADASKKLNQYIFPEFLSGIKTLGGGVTYAIPNNRTIGEYTYLLLNKEALNITYRRTDGGNTSYETYVSLAAADCERFLDDVHNYQTEKFYPLYKDSDISTFDIAKANANFFGIDENGKICDEFSVIGGQHDKTTSYGSLPNLGPVFSNANFLQTLKALKKYETNGYYYDATTDAGKKFAVGYVKGGAELAEKYADEYEVIAIENPTLTEESILESTFAVGANTMSLTRSMQILTMLNTDEAFRNLILYGIEGEHYRVIDTEVEKNELGDTYQQAERLNAKYVMDPEKTGNVFVSYPEYKGKNQDGSYVTLPSIYDWGIKQNQDARIDMLLGFDLDSTYYATDKEALKTIRTASAEIWAEYEKSTDFDAFLEFVDQKLGSVSKAYATLYTLTGEAHGEDGTVCENPECTSFLCAYIAWAKAAGIQ